MMSFDGLPRGRELAVMHERSTLVVEAPQLARDEFAVPREEAWRSSRLILVERFTLGVGRRITCGADVMQLEIGVSFDQNRPVVRSQARKRQHHADASQQEQQARAIFQNLQQGKIDRSLLTENASSYFSEQALTDFAAGLGPLGAPQAFNQTARQDRGGMTFRLFEVHFPQRTLEVWERVMPDGKIEQYQVMPRQ